MRCFVIRDMLPLWTRAPTNHGKRTFKSQYINDDEDYPLRDNAFIRDRWVSWFHTQLNTKSPTLEPNIVDELNQWPPCGQLDDAPSRYEVV